MDWVLGRHMKQYICLACEILSPFPLPIPSLCPLWSQKPRGSRKARSNAGSNRMSMGRKSAGGYGGGGMMSPRYESDDDSGTESVAAHQQRQQLQQQHSANLASALASPAHS